MLKKVFGKLIRFWKRHSILLTLLLIAGLAFFVRCLHLFDSSHYYIISADSHFFHWMADRVMDGQPVPMDVQPSGLTYPLAYIAKAISFGFSSQEDALAFASRFLPPFLGVITAIVLYLAVSRIWDRRVGLCSALAWAVLPHAYFIQGAGYLDRDGLNVLLITVGAFAFFLAKRWHIRIGQRDVGWVLAALVILGIELLLYFEWSWVGPGLLLAIIIAYFAAELLVKSLLGHEEPAPAAGYQTFSQRLFARIRSAVRESNWQPFALIISLNVLVALINLGTTSETIDFIEVLIASSGAEIAELQGIGLGDLRLYEVFLFLAPIGIFLAVMRRREGDIFVLSWLLALFILSLFARRIILYAAPAVAIIGAMTVASLWDFRYSRRLERRIQQIVAVLVVLIMIGLSARSYDLGSEQRVAANQDWQDGLIYLRDNAAEDAVVMSWWDFGYWILDVAQRRPVVDGGWLSHSKRTDDDIGLAYCTDRASDAVEVMRKYGADYLVFSRVEREIEPVIAIHGVGMENYVAWREGERMNSLWLRSLTGDFQSGGGLERVYPGPDVENPGLVVLGLTE
ncbi:MAG: hypothetical protein ISS53_02755 [Dehalococcoidia bacterium]|nr:hypothetical protein [Dehalococcoidia bacterium]